MLVCGKSMGSCLWIPGSGVLFSIVGELLLQIYPVYWHVCWHVSINCLFVYGYVKMENLTVLRVSFIAYQAVCYYLLMKALDHPFPVFPYEIHMGRNMVKWYQILSIGEWLLYKSLNFLLRIKWFVCSWSVLCRWEISFKKWHFKASKPRSKMFLLAT